MDRDSKLPWHVCGGRDVEVLAAIPRMNRDSAHSHSQQVIHVGGKRCWLDVIQGPIGATTKRMALNPTAY